MEGISRDIIRRQKNLKVEEEKIMERLSVLEKISKEEGWK